MTENEQLLLDSLPEGMTMDFDWVEEHSGMSKTMLTPIIASLEKQGKIIVGKDEDGGKTITKVKVEKKIAESVANIKSGVQRKKGIPTEEMTVAKRRERVLQIIKENPKIKNAEIAEKMGVSYSIAVFDVHTLRSQGELKGVKRLGEWIRPPDPLVAERRAKVLKTLTENPQISNPELQKLVGCNAKALEKDLVTLRKAGNKLPNRIGLNKYKRGGRPPKILSASEPESDFVPDSQEVVLDGESKKRKQTIGAKGVEVNGHKMKTRLRVLDLAQQGLKTEEICAKLGKSVNVVYYHLNRLRDKGKLPREPKRDMKVEVLELAKQGKTATEITDALHSRPAAVYKHLSVLRAECKLPQGSVDKVERETYNALRELNGGDVVIKASTPAPITGVQIEIRISGPAEKLKEYMKKIMEV